MILGGDFNIFRPKTVRWGDETFNAEVRQSQFRNLGPFPPKIREVFGDETYMSVLCLGQLSPPEKMAPFSRVTEREVVSDFRRKSNRKAYILERQRTTRRRLTYSTAKQS